MTLASNAGYGDAAAELAEQYESVSFADVHREVLPLFPPPPGAVLDVGAGSGRDAAALDALGYAVVAAEPTAELRELARRTHPGGGVEWVDDALPRLDGLRRAGRRFDLILSTAVWMHLDAAERPLAMDAVAGLLAPGGQVFLTLRHGPVPAGRRMFEVPDEETVELGRARGLRPVYRGGYADPHGRPDVRWSRLGLRREPAAGHAARS